MLSKADLIELVVTEGNSGKRIDQVLSQLLQVGSRAQAAKLIANNKVQVNGKTVKASYLTQVKDKIRLELIIQGPPTELAPLDIPLEILFEDSYLLVLNKPAGLVVHPAHGHQQDTLVNALIHHCKDLSMGFSENRPGIVHRLDKDTSGVLVVAKTNAVHTALADQFRNKTVHRKYWAIVLGVPKKPHDQIVSHLARHPIHRKKFHSEKSQNKSGPIGKLAITNYAILNSYHRELSLIECILETGRTHQIRVHLSELGHPIVGDQYYLNKSRLKTLKSTRLRAELSHLNRLGLHAASLGFVHPITKSHMSFSCGWPEQLVPLINKLEFD